MKTLRALWSRWRFARSFWLFDPSQAALRCTAVHCMTPPRLPSAAARMRKEGALSSADACCISPS